MNMLFSILILGGCLFLLIPGVYGDDQIISPVSQTVILKLIDTGGKTIDHTSLMKSGENYKDGQSRQVQNTWFNHETHELIWTPCNDNPCSYISLPTAGGKTGRDELILELKVSDPTVDVSSCYSDPTCERLKGGTSTVSGILEGIFYTGRTYEVSINSLKPGIREAFQVTEISS
ncbi:MAG: hypothetical protein LUQ50_15075 [Methanospirillum sp.]|uniref:hypothetical protein n=1 Tax=Methanospirillum sp. TaxID=45200 RepID=UPI002373ADC5|nr:hypothetical protein [Methanospirillum sp.]MDD1730375.1 hypothetical protein [Methanospirillum sp.]